MKHDLLTALNCSLQELEKLPHEIIAAHYEILLARDRKSRLSPMKNG